MDSIYAILLIALGSLGAASFYVPFKKVKSWAWESYWITQGVFAWIIIPWLFALIFVPAGDNLFATTGGILTVVGVAITIAGIIIIGYAGSLKSKEMTEEEKKAAV